MDTSLIFRRRRPGQTAMHERCRAAHRTQGGPVVSLPGCAGPSWSGTESGENDRAGRFRKCRIGRSTSLLARKCAARRCVMPLSPRAGTGTIHGTVLAHSLRFLP